MIALVRGRLVAKELDRVEIMTEGGTGYEIVIPLSAYETLPKLGDDAALFTHLVVRDDGWQLFGFASVFEKRVFQRLLTASGIGPALAMGMLSALTADRLVRAIREKDVPTLQRVPRVGRKKAERLILDLADKLDEMQAEAAEVGGRPESAGADDAMRALVSLGYSAGDADKAVRSALDDGGRGTTPTDLIRRALARVGSR